MSAELRNAPCRAKAEATVERTLSNTADQLGIGAVKRAMLPIEVHRHPAVSAILDGRGIDGGLDLVAAERRRESGVYSGLQTTLYAAWLATTAAAGRMGGIRSFTKTCVDGARDVAIERRNFSSAFSIDQSSGRSEGRELDCDCRERAI
jgi:hypothetical protein